MRTVLLLILVVFFTLTPIQAETVHSVGKTNAPLSVATDSTLPFNLYDPRSGENPNRAIYNISPFPDRPSTLAQVTSSGGLWIGGDRVALLEAGQWIELSCFSPSFLVGVYFRGDENDGYARVYVDGAEVWHGDTYGPVGNQFDRHLEVPNLPVGPHTLRIEATGQIGGEGTSKGNDVAILAFSCTIEMPYNLFLPQVRK